MGCGASKTVQETVPAEPHAAKQSAAKAAPAPAVAGNTDPYPVSVAGNMDTFKSMLDAWGKGEFASLDNPAWSKHLAKDVKFDASAAAGLHPVFKTYEGYAGFKEWLDMLAGMDLKDLDIKFVDGPKSAPGTVVQKVTVTMTSKTTGKTTPGPVTDILVWEFDESHKVKYGKIYFGAPDNLAYVLDKDAPSVTPQPVMPVPPPEMTSEKALAAFGKIYGAWGTGAFNNPETKAAAQAEMWTEDIVMDVTAAALSPAENPGIYRLLHGFKGGDQWVNDVIGEWEMSGLDMSGEGAFASPTPGAAMHRFTSTIKHKGTGKECKDGVDIVEWFFDKDGKCSGGKFFWGNPKGVAATYPPMPAPPPAVTAFFDGKPMAGKVEALPTLLDEALVLEFIGPYAGATTGLKLDKPKMLGTAAKLVASFSDFTFNPKAVPPVKGVDGGWWAKMHVTGTFDGEPFTPMPDKLPALEKTGKAWEIGPEVFTVYTDESGEKITRVTIEAQYPGALVGPPGIYVACGGKLG